MISQGNKVLPPKGALRTRIAVVVRRVVQKPMTGEYLGLFCAQTSTKIRYSNLVEAPLQMGKERYFAKVDLGQIIAVSLCEKGTSIKS